VHNTGFYKNTVEEELLEHSPAAYVRSPRVDYEFHAAALDRNELGALTAPTSSTSVWNAATGLSRFTRKGGEVVTICSRRALPGRSTWPSASAPAHRCS